MNNTGKISIALCTYNGEKYLSAQLESYLAQTILPDELIISDDHSTDKTVGVITEFSRRAPFPVRCTVNKQNLGSTKNFEETIKRCTGEFIFLSDQDDVWMPDKIRRTKAEFDRSGATGLVFSNAELIGEDLEPLGSKLWDKTMPAEFRRKKGMSEILRKLLIRNVATGATMAFRSSFVNDIIPFPAMVPGVFHDNWIVFVISAMAEVVPIDEPLIKYRVHPGQQVGVDGLDLSGPIRDAYARSTGILKQKKNGINELISRLSEYPTLHDNGEFKTLLSENVEEIAERILHLENRDRLLDKNPGRLRIIWNELSSGRYHRFSNGIKSCVKDLFL